jgi:hypothetical protein
MASISGFSKMRFIEVLQAQMKRPRPENTPALHIIVPYATSEKSGLLQAA